jgi:putative hydrolase
VIDLHTHTLLSDGSLLPAELARRAQVLGARLVVFADHVDGSNVEPVVTGLAAVARELTGELGYKVVGGAEVTHVPPGLIGRVVERARGFGAGVVVVHGETIVEPVAPGTNRAAIEAGADVLAHPGFITADDARLAADRGVALEISAKRGHCLTNGYVAGRAREAGAGMVFGSDTHAPGDICPRAKIEDFLRGAGLTAEEVAAALDLAHSIGLRGFERMCARGGAKK